MGSKKEDGGVLYPPGKVGIAGGRKATSQDYGRLDRENTNALPRPLPPTHPSSSVKGPGRMGAVVPIWKGPWGGVPPERGGVHSRSFLAMCENSSLLFFPRFETALARGGGTTRTPPNRYSMSVTCAPPLSLSLIAPLGGPLSLAWVVCVCMYGQGKAVCMQGRAAGSSAPLHE